MRLSRLAVVATAALLVAGPATVLAQCPAGPVVVRTTPAAGTLPAGVYAPGQGAAVPGPRLSHAVVRPAPAGGAVRSKKRCCQVRDLSCCPNKACCHTL